MAACPAFLDSAAKCVTMAGKGKEAAAAERREAVEQLWICLFPGGLVLFWFGMGVMGKSLEKQVGRRLQRAPVHLADSRLKGFVLGAAFAAAVQSPAAVAVMAMGFVNSGLLSLRGALGAMAGGSVGATVSGWVFSLVGLRGAGFPLCLLAPPCLAAAAGLAGMVLYRFCRVEKCQGAGAILLGFAVLLAGLEAMGSAAGFLVRHPWFAGLATVVANPLAGLPAGALLAGALQSPAAATGVLQALASTGEVPYAAVLPVLLGQNIGGCAPALFASIGANQNARRTALAQLYFHILAAAAGLLLLYGLDAWGFPGLLQRAASPAGLALANSGFQLLAAAVLLPAAGVLEKLARLSIPGGSQEEQFQLLDQRLLGQPALAVRRAGDVALTMARRAHKSLVQGMSLTHTWDDGLAAEVAAGEEQIDGWEDALSTYLLLLGRQDLTLEESRTVSSLLHTLNDFERIGDHAVQLVELARETRAKNLCFSEQARRDLAVLERAVQEILTRTLTAFALVAARPAGAGRSGAKEAAAAVEPLEQTIDELVQAVRARHVTQLRQGRCALEAGFVLLDLIHQYGRVADHCSNVAAVALSADTDARDMHRYLERMRASGRDYAARVDACRRQYTLD